MNRGLGFFAAVLAAGAVVGSLLGELLGLVFPTGFLHAFFSRGVAVGIPRLTLDLLALKLNLGLTLQVNLCTVLGVAAAFYLLRR